VRNAIEHHISKVFNGIARFEFNWLKYTTIYSKIKEIAQCFPRFRANDEFFTGCQIL